MTLTDMRRWIAEHDLRLTKSLGQNFLHDGNQLRRIIQAADLVPPGPVLEIGPGLGPLTELLLGAGCPVMAIEMDQRLVSVLQKRFAGEPGLNLIHGDALEVLRNSHVDWTEYKVVANLPYSVGSPLLVDMALRPTAPSLIVVTLQLEVAQRIRARESTPEYGLLSLLLGWRYTVEASFRIPASCFFPPPDVDSACIRLRRRPGPLVEGERVSRFLQIIRQAFSQRRKMMWKLLRLLWTEESLAAAFTAAGIPREARAEAVSLEQFVVLAHQLPRNNLFPGIPSPPAERSCKPQIVAGIIPSPTRKES